MSQKPTVTPSEAAAILSSAAQETVAVRKILYWAKMRVSGFPALVTDVSPKFQRFDRVEIETWAKEHFPLNAPPDSGARRARKSGDA